MPGTDHKPVVAVFFGLTGAGKSYVGRRWAERRGYPYHNSDQVRKELAGVAPDSRHHVPVNEGLYSPEHTERTYAELLRRAVRDIVRRSAAGVVLDATYGDERRRGEVVAAFAGGCQVAFILCRCSDGAVRERFDLRRQDERAVSDGRWEIYLDQKRRFAPPAAIAGANLLLLDTEDQVGRLIERVDAFIDAAGQEQ